MPNSGICIRGAEVKKIISECGRQHLFQKGAFALIRHSVLKLAHWQAQVSMSLYWLGKKYPLWFGIKEVLALYQP
jgi:hypothetical protein